MGSNLLWTSFTIIFICSSVSVHCLYDIQGATLLPKKLDAGVALTLPYELTIFNQRFTHSTKYWISSNGYISIGKELPEFETRPLPLNISTEDSLLIAPYKARIEYRPAEQSDTEASVSYKVGLSEEELTRVERDVQNNVVGQDKFKSTKSFVVTWRRLSFNSGNPASTIPYPRNTFQFVLVADSESTFALFNYQEIVWDGGYAYGGDVETGTGAKNPPAQAGFNLGGGQGFISLPYNGSVLEADQGQSSSVKGQYIYKISSALPEAKGCIRFPKSDAPNPVQLHPSRGPMNGGNLVEVSGPCFTEQQSIFCRFGSKKTKAKFINQSKAVCFVPVFFENGRISFNVVVDGKEDSTTETFYFLSNLEPAGVTLVDGPLWTLVAAKRPLEIRWQPRQFPADDKIIDIKLFTYTENVTHFGWNEEKTIAKGIPNTGSYQLETHKLHCKHDCHKKDFGALVVELPTSPDSQSPGRLWTDTIPLGWYVAEAFQQELGTSWPDMKCYDWFKRDNDIGLGWLDELEKCPCTMYQALVDVGRFIPDPWCNLNTPNTPDKCFYHKGAAHCIRSIWPSNITGAGTQCCYNGDGHLMYAADTIQGSTVDKGHALGAAPYNKPGRIPDLSHWLEDVITYQYCCLWNKLNTTCAIYMDQRPTKDCGHYHAVRTALAFGYCHFATFDGPVYSQQLIGDYTLFSAQHEVGGAIVQGRFAFSDPSITATVLTGIVAREMKSDRVEIILSTTAVRELQKTIVMVNGVEVKFSSETSFTQKFQGLKIICWSQMPADQSSFTVSFESGLGLNISANQHQINILASVPVSYKMYEGLLGVWSEDELISASRQSPHTFKSIAEFSVFSARRSDMFTHSRASGSLPDTFPSLNSPEAVSLCGNNSQCLFDFRVTNSTMLADQTRVTLEHHAALLSYTSQVRSCGMPVEHGVRDGNVYLENMTTTIVACRHGYQLVGKHRSVHTCGADGQWMPTINSSCYYTGYPEFTSMKDDTVAAHSQPSRNHLVGLAVGLTVGCLVLVALVVGAFFFIRMRRQIRNKKSGSSEEAATQLRSGQTADSATISSDKKAEQQLETSPLCSDTV